MLENVLVAQIKKFKKQSPFIFEFWFWEDPPHQSTGPQPIPKCISLKCIFPKCIYPKCISAKCIRLACLLSFASLFSLLLQRVVYTERRSGDKISWWISLERANGLLYYIQCKHGCINFNILERECNQNYFGPKLVGKQRSVFNAQLIKSR